MYAHDKRALKYINKTHRINKRIRQIYNYNWKFLIPRFIS